MKFRPAFKVWISRSLQKQMARFRPAVNWSAVVRSAIEKKIRELSR